MGEIYRLYTEAGYDATSKTTGSGQAQAWDATSRLGGGGSGDVKVTIVNQNPVFADSSVLDLSSAPSVRCRIYIDSSDMAFSSNALFTVAALRINSGSRVVGFCYSFSSGQHAILFQKTNDGGVSVANNSVNITQGEHYIEILLTKASTSMSSDGSVTYFIDNVQVAQRTGMDLYDDFALINQFRIGAHNDISSLDAGTSGDLFVGKIIIRDDANLIGPYSPYNQQAFNQLRRRRRLSS